MSVDTPVLIARSGMIAESRCLRQDAGAGNHFMKALRYLTITLAIVAILAGVGWYLRDALIQRISKPILEDYDVEVVDVSLDALGTHNASIAYLELVHDNGTTIVIEGLTLPVRTMEDAARLYMADTVSIVTADRDDDSPFDMARLIDQILSLTDTLSGTEIYIEEFSFAPIPVVHDLSWTLSDTEQAISGTVGSLGLSAMTSRLDPTTYTISFSLPDQTATRDDRISGRLQQDNLGVSIAGDSILDLPGWENITKLVGIIPDAIEIRSGTAGLHYEVNISYDTAQLPSVTAALTPTSLLEIAYVGESDDSTDLSIGQSSAVEIAATFPEVEWFLKQAETSLTVTNGEWHDIPLTVNDVSCQTGPVCTMKTDTSWNEAEMPIGAAEQIEVTSSLDISFSNEGVRVDVRPDATLELTGFSSSTNSIALLEAHMISAATMQYTDDGWEFSADSIDATTELFSLSDDTYITAPVFLEKVAASERDRILSVKSGAYVPSSQLNLNERTVTTPGFRGNVSLQDSDVVFALETVDLFENGTINGQHNLDSRIGEIAIVDTALSFDNAALSTQIAPWRNDWDISAGNVALTMQANWSPSDSELAINASSTFGIENLSGFYTDTAFAGLSTEIEFEYDANNGFVVQPAAINVALIDIGLAIENLTADVTLDANKLAFEVANLRMMAFNGEIGAEPFSFHTGRDINNVTLTAKGVELAELLSIKEFAAVVVNGTIGAVLPITIETDGISISEGTLTGESPGGVIRYLAVGDPDETDTSAIGLATEALSNFEYESLTSTVSYAKDGNLKLQMQLKGRNPDMDNSRPVLLNLGVENNVIQMLRSLQAARAVEEILERQLAE